MSDKETEIRERLEKATPGPWAVGRESFEWNSPSSPRQDIVRKIDFGHGQETTYLLAHVCYPTTTGNTVGAAERKANADLIAHAPTDIRYLLDENARLRAELAELDKVLTELCRLKALKDRVGKTPEYESDKRQAWANAFAIAMAEDKTR